MGGAPWRVRRNCSARCTLHAACATPWLDTDVHQLLSFVWSIALRYQYYISQPEPEIGGLLEMQLLGTFCNQNCIHYKTSNRVSRMQLATQDAAQDTALGAATGTTIIIATTPLGWCKWSKQRDSVALVGWRKTVSDDSVEHKSR